MMIRRLAVLALCVGTTAVSCANNPKPQPPVTFISTVAPYDFGIFMTRFQPPEEYERWMELVEKCSGLYRQPGEPEDTYWWVGRRYLQVNAAHDSATVAQHNFVRHQIYFGIGWEWDSTKVIHEMLHHRLSIAGDKLDHDPAYFAGKCRRELGG